VFQPVWYLKNRSSSQSSEQAEPQGPATGASKSEKLVQQQQQQQTGTPQQFRLQQQEHRLKSGWQEHHQVGSQQQHGTQQQQEQQQHWGGQPQGQYSDPAIGMHARIQGSTPSYQSPWSPKASSHSMGGSMAAVNDPHMPSGSHTAVIPKRRLKAASGPLTIGPTQMLNSNMSLEDMQVRLLNMEKLALVLAHEQHSGVDVRCSVLVLSHSSCEQSNI